MIFHPTFEEQRYRLELLGLCKSLQAFVLEQVKSDQFKSSYNSNIRYDDISNRLELALEYIKLKAAYEVSKIVSSLMKRAARIDSFNQKRFKSLVNALSGVSIEYSEEHLKAQDFITSKPSRAIEEELKLWALENARLVKSIPEQMLNKLAGIITQGVRERNSTSSLSNELTKLFNISKSRAKVIARDQVAKLNGRLTQHRNLELGITQYKWLTGRDERVRHSHQVLEGKICSWTDESIYKDQDSQKWKQRSTIKGIHLHPGLDIMCRCTSIAVL